MNQPRVLLVCNPASYYHAATDAAQSSR